MYKTLTQEEFKISKRELLLNMEIYESNFTGSLRTFDTLNRSFQQPLEILRKIPAVNFMMATRRRAWAGINHLATAYSAGHAISEISEFYPKVLEFWEEYAKYDKAYDATPRGR
ncbi:hypothetical protein, partial [Janthinobacterium sp. BJB401]|uniref:hypothetical protein n=1 Tax=Janthinobacterium sp. BJB401 TaxID=2745934 RepID=UPI0015963DD5